MDEKWKDASMDQEWIKEAKKTAELLEPPVSLSPEAVTAALKQKDDQEKKGKTKKIFRFYRVMAAVFALFLVGGIGFFAVDHMGRRENDAFVKNDEAPEQDAAGSYRAAASHGEIYEYLKTAQEDWEAQADGTEGFELGVEAETEAAASADSKGMEAAEDFSQTNTQVAGIDEGDIVKTDGEYLYLVRREANATGTVRIVKANGGELEEVSSITSVTEGVYADYDSVMEMYLEGNSLILILDCYDENGLNYTAIAVYDVTDKREPRLVHVLEQDGAYDSSRKNGDYLYLFTKKYADFQEKEWERGYIPYVEGKALEAEHIYYPEEIRTNCMLVASSVDLKTPERFLDSEAVYFESGVIYVSSHSIYVGGHIWDAPGKKSQTEIFKLTYENGAMEVKADKKILGTLHNQFSMDEYEGYLRLVATVSDYETGGTANSLYILDENLEITGTIHNLAPDEEIYSARFMGDTGYFVTFRQIDPLFSVDLSDPAAPKVMGELKITGFSSYLHEYGDGLLLGIGQEVNPRTSQPEGMKLSMFDTSDPYDVTEKDKKVLYGMTASPALYDHKAVLIDPEKNLFGFFVWGNYSEKGAATNQYVLFSYEAETGFSEQVSIDLGPESETYVMDDVRGVYIGDVIYLIVDGSVVKSYSMETGDMLGQITLTEGRM